jgi:hypothetical protein
MKRNFISIVQVVCRKAVKHTMMLNVLRAGSYPARRPGLPLSTVSYCIR